MYSLVIELSLTLTLILFVLYILALIGEYLWRKGKSYVRSIWADADGDILLAKVNKLAGSTGETFNNVYQDVKGRVRNSLPSIPNSFEALHEVAVTKAKERLSDIPLALKYVITNAKIGISLLV